MKKSFYLIVVILFFSIFTIACDNEINYNLCYTSNINYEVEMVFVYKNEEYNFDIEKQFALSGIDITSYELRSSDEEVAIVNKNKLIGNKTGKVSINGMLYEKSSKTKYLVKVATVYFINTEDMIEIRTAEELTNMNNNKRGHYILKSDIDLANYGLWQPIGSSPFGNQFSGIFVNPEGYKIENLTVTSSKDFIYTGTTGFCSVGLFGSIVNSYIDGIILENVYLDVSDYEAKNPGANAGGIVSSMLTSVVRNCHVTGTIIAQSYSGGIVGANSWGYILDCSFKGTVKTISGWSSESGAGGIVGHSATEDGGGMISNCYVNAEVVSHVSAGGIVGTMGRGHFISNCTFEGTVIGNKYQNELIGRTR